MTKTLTAAKAKSNFEEALREAEAGDRVVITRKGRPVAALISIGDLSELSGSRKFDPSQGLAGIAGGWPGSEELVEQLEKHRRSGPRAPVEFE